MSLTAREGSKHRSLARLSCGKKSVGLLSKRAGGVLYMACARENLLCKGLNLNLQRPEWINPSQQAPSPWYVNCLSNSVSVHTPILCIWVTSTLFNINRLLESVLCTCFLWETVCSHGRNKKSKLSSDSYCFSLQFWHKFNQLLKTWKLFHPFFPKMV